MRRTSITFGDHARMQALGIDCRDLGIDQFCWRCGAVVVKPPHWADLPIRDPEGTYLLPFYGCPWLIHPWKRMPSANAIVREIIRAEMVVEARRPWREPDLPRNASRRKDLRFICVMSYLQERLGAVSIEQLEAEARRWNSRAKDDFDDHRTSIAIGRRKHIQAYLEKMLKLRLVEVEVGDDGVPYYRFKSASEEGPVQGAEGKCAHDFHPETRVCRRCDWRFVQLQSMRNGGVLNGIFRGMQASPESVAEAHETAPKE